jgi:hypothetical protein
VFEVVTGLPTPTLFVLTPATIGNLAAIEGDLERDEAFLRAAAPYFDAPATDPVYVRQEVALLAAFAKVPHVEVPAATATKGLRLFELRTYESHNERAHHAKVRMFSEDGRDRDLSPRRAGAGVLLAHAGGPAHAEPRPRAC